MSFGLSDLAPTAIDLRPESSRNYFLDEAKRTTPATFYTIARTGAISNSAGFVKYQF